MLLHFTITENLKKKLLILIGVSIGLLLLVKFAGQQRLGAQRWIMIGPFSLQPSEFVKVMVILILGAFITKNYKNGINNILDVIVVFLPISVITVLILIQPDLGSALAIILYFIYDFSIRGQIKTAYSNGTDGMCAGSSCIYVRIEIVSENQNNHIFES